MAAPEPLKLLHRENEVVAEALRQKSAQQPSRVIQKQQTRHSGFVPGYTAEELTVSIDTNQIREEVGLQSLNTIKGEGTLSQLQGRSAETLLTEILHYQELQQTYQRKISSAEFTAAFNPAEQDFFEELLEHLDAYLDAQKRYIDAVLPLLGYSELNELFLDIGTTLGVTIKKGENASEKVSTAILANASEREKTRLFLTERLSNPETSGSVQDNVAAYERIHQMNVLAHKKFVDMGDHSMEVLARAVAKFNHMAKYYAESDAWYHAEQKKQMAGFVKSNSTQGCNPIQILLMQTMTKLNLLYAEAAKATPPVDYALFELCAMEILPDSDHGAMRDDKIYLNKATRQYVVRGSDGIYEGIFPGDVNIEDMQSMLSYIAPQRSILAKVRRGKICLDKATRQYIVSGPEGIHEGVFPDSVDIEDVQSMLSYTSQQRQTPSLEEHAVIAEVAADVHALHALTVTKALQLNETVRVVGRDQSTAVVPSIEANPLFQAQMALIDVGQTIEESVAAGRARMARMSSMLQSAAVTFKETVFHQHDLSIDIDFSEFAQTVLRQVSTFQTVAEECPGAGERVQGWEFFYHSEGVAEPLRNALPTEFKARDKIAIHHRGEHVVTVVPAPNHSAGVTVHRHEDNDMDMAVSVMVAAISAKGQREIVIATESDTLALQYACVILRQGAIPILKDGDKLLDRKESKQKLQAIAQGTERERIGGFYNAIVTRNDNKERDKRLAAATESLRLAASKNALRTQGTFNHRCRDSAGYPAVSPIAVPQRVVSC